MITSHKLLGCILLFVGAAHAADGCQLKKVFHHRMAGKEHDLELGNVVLYCDKYPTIIKNNDQGKKGRHQVRFLLQSVITTPESSVMIAAFNRIETADYYVRIVVDATKRELALVLDYDPQKISFSYDTFEAITRDKGIIFRLYNQKLLKALKNKEAKILQLSYAHPTIIIDCGHGGYDTGAQGMHDTIEKNIVFAVGKELEQLLKKAGFTVCMTRESDVFVSLDERTHRANEVHRPALFISLHANAAATPQASGIETYCLSSQLFNQQLATCIDVAPLYDALYHVSSMFAQSLHNALLDEVRSMYPQVVNRKVRQAAAQVLMGTSVPATLVELGFVSHDTEAQYLQKREYQKLLAQGLYHGIIQFSATHS